MKLNPSLLSFVVLSALTVACSEAGGDADSGDGDGDGDSRDGDSPGDGDGDTPLGDGDGDGDGDSAPGNWCAMDSACDSGQCEGLVVDEDCITTCEESDAACVSDCDAGITECRSSCQEEEATCTVGCEEETEDCEADCELNLEGPCSENACDAAEEDCLGGCLSIQACGDEICAPVLAAADAELDALRNDCLVVAEEECASIIEEEANFVCRADYLASGDHETCVAYQTRLEEYETVDVPADDTCHFNCAYAFHGCSAVCSSARSSCPAECEEDCKDECATEESCKDDCSAGCEACEDSDCPYDCDDIDDSCRFDCHITAGTCK